MNPSEMPLSLYVHMPWCVRKCPYCDFNSHELQQGADQQAYITALLHDLRAESPLAMGREVRSVFIGGGTPSLFDGDSIQRLLTGVREDLSLAAQAEITLEANPGTVDAAHFAGYREAGVNRLSIGAQSFSAEKLEALGRIHNPNQIVVAAETARRVGIDNINIDLMFGLPGQTIAQALDDLGRAIELAPEHLSWYQLTLEPNTLFHSQPPPLPGDELIIDMQEAGQALLAEAGYQQYEVSAYAKPGRECLHNRNYWEFGDYLGVGAGAHGKVTSTKGVCRRWKVRHPTDFIASSGRGEALSGDSWLSLDDLRLEFMLNALRLKGGVPSALLQQRTGLEISDIATELAAVRERGLLDEGSGLIKPTSLGYRFLNDLIAMFDMNK
ncbi:MAG: radical SAM family heme chaperone HemW [bacterium]